MRCRRRRMIFAPPPIKEMRSTKRGRWPNYASRDLASPVGASCIIVAQTEYLIMNVVPCICIPKVNSLICAATIRAGCLGVWAGAEPDLTLQAIRLKAAKIVGIRTIFACGFLIIHRLVIFVLLLSWSKTMVLYERTHKACTKMGHLKDEHRSGSSHICV